MLNLYRLAHHDAYRVSIILGHSKRALMLKNLCLALLDQCLGDLEFSNINCVYLDQAAAPHRYSSLYKALLNHSDYALYFVS